MQCECGATDEWTPPVAMMLVFIVGRHRPVPLMPEEENTYQLCQHCDALPRFVQRAVDLAPCSKGGVWTRALIVFDDYQGIEVEPIKPKAQA